ncbi:MAG: IS3 family transposase, partial [Hyphomicrobium sp.]|nr:IS3 family transposase [Hyphomicrobium sp.]
MKAAHDLARHVGRKRACRALNLPRASFYRHLHGKVAPAPRASPARALAMHERDTVLEHLHGERFRDHAPAQVYATLLDEGVYLCSIRTMYRILQSAGEARERRDQLRHPNYAKPEL